MALQPGELKELVSDFDILIAGTEEIDISVFEAVKTKTNSASELG